MWLFFLDSPVDELHVISNRIVVKPVRAFNLTETDRRQKDAV